MNSADCRRRTGSVRAPTLPLYRLRWCNAKTHQAASSWCDLPHRKTGHVFLDGASRSLGVNGDASAK
jgi:hypothetical protein